jgi:hypothetical protein
VPRSKNEWSYTSTPQYAFMAWCSVKKHKDNFTFYYESFKTLAVPEDEHGRDLPALHGHTSYQKWKEIMIPVLELSKTEQSSDLVTFVI